MISVDGTTRRLHTLQVGHVDEVGRVAQAIIVRIQCFLHAVFPRGHLLGPGRADSRS